MTDTTTGAQPTPPSTPTGGAPNGQGQPTPVATPPAGPATPPAPPANPGQVTPPTAPPASDPGKNDDKPVQLTQSQLDKLINDRLDRDRASQQKAFGDKLAELFGAKPESGGATKPEDVLAQAQKIVEQAQTRANVATARAYAQGEVKTERVDALLGMLDVPAVLKDVDAGDVTAVDAALKAAVAAKAAEFPEWKPGPTLPGASTANPSTPGGNGKRVYTRDELSKMPQSELAKIADDLVLAQREGRIK